MQIERAFVGYFLAGLFSAIHNLGLRKRRESELLHTTALDQRLQTALINRDEGELEALLEVPGIDKSLIREV